MENYIKMKYLLILFTTFTFSQQDWNLTQNEILQPQTTVSYENVYLNGYTIEMKNGSGKYVYITSKNRGSGSPPDRYSKAARTVFGDIF